MTDTDRQCQATYIAQQSGAYVYDRNGNSWRWLRSPGNNSRKAAGVGVTGSIDTNGYYVYVDSGVVRPALWLIL